MFNISKEIKVFCFCKLSYSNKLLSTLSYSHVGLGSAICKVAKLAQKKRTSRSVQILSSRFIGDTCT